VSEVLHLPTSTRRVPDENQKSKPFGRRRRRRKMPKLGVKKLYKSIKSQALDEPLWVLRTKAATNKDTWGPTGTQLNELSRATTFGPETFNQIFNVLFYRLDERDSKWRKCYKALIVLEFFLLRGDAHCINPVRIGRFAPKLRELQHFRYVDPLSGRDAGQSIRQRARDIVELAEDEELLQEKREKARQRRDCVGISSDDTIPSFMKKRVGGTGSEGSIEETYTAGRRSFSRNGSRKNSGSFPLGNHQEVVDDWGDSSSMSPTASMVVPKSLIESPDVHHVRVSKDAMGRVQSIESKKVKRQGEAEGEAEGEDDQDQDRGGFGLDASPSSSTGEQKGKKKHLSKGKRSGGVVRRLSAPPSSLGNEKINQNATSEEEGTFPNGKLNSSSRSIGIGGDFFDFFDTNVNIQAGPAASASASANQNQIQNDHAMRMNHNPHQDESGGEILIAPKVTNPFVSQTGGERGTSAAVFPVEAETTKSLIDTTPEKQKQNGFDGGNVVTLEEDSNNNNNNNNNNSELFDWTSAIGFDFQKLDLDTSTSPYKTLSSSYNMHDDHHPLGLGHHHSPFQRGASSVSKGKKKGTATVMGPPMRSVGSNGNWEAFH